MCQFHRQEGHLPSVSHCEGLARETHVNPTTHPLHPTGSQNWLFGSIFLPLQTSLESEG